MKQNGNGDYVTSHYGKVICISRYGEFKWHYTGIDTQTEMGVDGLPIILKKHWRERMNPSGFPGLVCDTYQNIIIAEYNFYRISMLNSDGKLLRTLMTNGVDFPLSLVLDSLNHLWIGQENEIKVIKYTD